MDGWRLLDILKRTAETRHIPIHIISVRGSARARHADGRVLGAGEAGGSRDAAAGAGAHARNSSRGRSRSCCWSKTTTCRAVRSSRSSATAMCMSRTCAPVREALQALQRALLRLHRARPGAAGHGWPAADRDDPPDRSRRLPVIIHTAKDLSSGGRGEAAQPGRVVHPQGPGVAAAVVRRDRAVPASRTSTGMPEDKRRIIDRARRREPGLAGRKVLIVDDDIRNIFSLTGVLEQHDIQVLHAESGRDGIEHAGDDAGHRHGADGRDDARHGWLRDHAPDPRAANASASCR